MISCGARGMGTEHTARGCGRGGRSGSATAMLASRQLDAPVGEGSGGTVIANRIILVAAVAVMGIARPVSVVAFLQEAALESFLLVGLFLLGGEFWGNVRVLFRHRAKVEFSPHAPAIARA